MLLSLAFVHMDDSSRHWKDGRVEGGGGGGAGRGRGGGRGDIT